MNRRAGVGIGGAGVMVGGTLRLLIKPGASYARFVWKCGIILEKYLVSL